MNTSKESFVISTLSLAVQGALAAMIVLPMTVFADDDVTALTHPTNSVEIGTEYVPIDSAKFGEYNGLNKKGAYLIGNFSVRGGDAYDAFMGGSGINRWEITGTDLGTTSRALSANFSNQGKWSVGVGYDELQHNITDSYQTPFQGSLGSNNFGLPTTFGAINVGLDANDVTQPNTGTQALSPTQLGAFQTQEVYTSRKNASFNAGYTFDQQWSVLFDYNHLQQSGAKLIGAASDTSGTPVGGAGEYNVTLMNPTNYQTDTFELALNWVGEKGHLTGSLFGSIFEDGYSSLTWSNPFIDSNTVTSPTSPPPNTFATPPSNDFYQLNFLGGYDFTSATKLAGGLSYSRNTQNSSFINDPLLNSPLTQASLNGLVVKTHLDLKLTNQMSKNLSLSVGVKYDERDNRTPSNAYSFSSIAGDSYTGVVNAPVSDRKTQLELAGTYRIDKKQSAQFAYEHESIRRWCNNLLPSPDPTNATGIYNDPTTNSFTGIGFNSSAPYSNNACVLSPESNENKLSTSYKLKASDDLVLKASYTYASRVASISSFYNPMQANSAGFENQGFAAYYNGSRTEQLFKAGVDWQTSDKSNVGLSGRYLDDKYDATLGVQKIQTWSLNLDAAYDYSHDGNVSAYLTTQWRQRDLLSSADQSPAAPAADLWTNRLKDDSNTIGVKAKQKGLMGSKLELTGDLSYSLAKSGYSTQNINCADPTGNNTATGICGTTGTLPDIKNEIVKLKVTGNYHIDKVSKVAFGYRFQKQTTNDYYYSAYQTGYTDPGVLPTNQQAPNYTINVFSISYGYSF